MTHNITKMIYIVKLMWEKTDSKHIEAEEQMAVVCAPDLYHRPLSHFK